MIKVLIHIIPFYVEYISVISFYFLKIFLNLFLDRGVGREKKRERNINVWMPFEISLLGTWSAAHTCMLTGNRTGDPLVHRPALSSLSHTSQGIKLLNSGRN